MPELHGAGPDVRLRRARMQVWREMDQSIVGARGRILDPGGPLRLFEEEVPRGGLEVTRSWQLARGADGRTYLWMARRKRPGRASGDRASDSTGCCATRPDGHRYRPEPCDMPAGRARQGGTIAMDDPPSRVPLVDGGDGLILTDAQRAAVEWGDGPLMVLAGAGTGQDDRRRRARPPPARARPDAPAREHPRPDLQRPGGRRADAPPRTGARHRARGPLWVHNFHSFGYRLLREHRAELGLSASADLLDQVGQRLLLREPPAAS